MTDKETATFEIEVEVSPGRPYASRIESVLRIDGFDVKRVERTDLHHDFSDLVRRN